MADRVWQALLKLAAEPAYEATAEERSYGFRPGRCTADAQKLIFNNLNKQANGEDKLILETDISKCFDSRQGAKAQRDTITLQLRDSTFSLNSFPPAV